MHKQKAIVINYTGRKGGGALDAYEITKALIDQGECVIAIISKHIENISMWKNLPLEKLILLDTYTSKISYAYKTMFFSLVQAKRILRECEKYSIKAVFCPMSTFWTYPINKLFPKAKKIVVNHDPIAHSGAGRLSVWLMERPYSYADVIVVHSKKFIEYASSLYGDVRYLPLGRHDIYKHAANKKKVIQYESGKINFLFFGRITPYKGIDVLASAMRRINEKYKNEVNLSIVGNGDFSPYQETFSCMSNVKVVNRWIADEEVESVFQGENLVCVCPYKDATQSGVILVAFDYGVPVIASDAGGIEEQIIHQKTGLLVKPGSDEELALAMEYFIQNPKVMENMREDIEFYLKEISWSKTAKELIGIIED